jgi:predicted DNA-binding protein (MmcQ/YjbR family)
MTADDFREIALSMDGASERAHMGHPDFRANGRIFASLHATEKSGTVKLPPDEQRELLRIHPKTFTPASGAWGRQGWTSILLDGADRAAVRGAITLAWQDVARQAPGRASRKSGTSAGRRRARRTKRTRT